jgi:acyl-CoA thioester hydrolase
MTELTVTRRVQFYETDQAGMVHFSWYPRYMEETEHALWRASGLGIASVPHVGFPRVAIAVDFKAPLRFEEEFTVTIRIEELGRRTIRYACVMGRGKTTVATGSMTVACVRRDGDALAAADIPDEVRARLGAPGPPAGDPV